MAYSFAHSHYHLLRMKEMGRVYWCHSLGAAGIALVSIFIPIFLLKSGYSFRAVIIFILLQQLISVVLQIPIARMFEKVTPHQMMALGNLFYAVMFGFLITLHTYKWPLALVALIWAMNRTTYWVAFHYTFSSARAHKASRQIAGINALNMLATTAAPAIGGIVATLFGINSIYWVAIVLLVVAVLPMLSKSEGPRTVKLHLPKHEFKRMRRDMFANIFNATVLMAEGNIWPLFVYLIVTSYAGIGALSSVIALASILITLYVGKHQEISGGRPYIKRGVGAYSLTSIGRALAQNSTQVFGLNMLAGIGRSLYVTPYMDRYYHHSDSEFRLGYITAMETGFCVGSALFMLLPLTLSYFFATDTVLSISLGFVAFSAVGVRLMRDVT